jgi:hypothetical protein
MPVHNHIVRISTAGVTYLIFWTVYVITLEPLDLLNMLQFCFHAKNSAFSFSPNKVGEAYALDHGFSTPVYILFVE